VFNIPESMFYILHSLYFSLSCFVVISSFETVLSITYFPSKLFWSWYFSNSINLKFIIGYWYCIKILTSCIFAKLWLLCICNCPVFCLWNSWDFFCFYVLCFIFSQYCLNFDFDVCPMIFLQTWFLFKPWFNASCLVFPFPTQIIAQKHIVFRHLYFN